MSRRRSISIYATSKEQYLEKFSDITNNKYLKESTNKKSNDYEFLTYDNSLGRQKSYKMHIIQPKLCDKEADEIKYVERSLNLLENTIQNNNKISFYYLIKHFFCQEDNRKSDIPINNNFHKQSSNKLAVNVSKLIKENLLVPQKIYKILILGSRSSGKSSFINRLLDLILYIPNSSNFSFPVKPFDPTKSINIVKKIFRINNSHYLSQLELIDTNEEIGKSQIVNVYLRFCRSVIILSTYCYDSIEFAKKQIKRIRLYDSNIQIIMILNGKYDEIIFEEQSKYLDDNNVYLFEMNLENLGCEEDKLEILKIFYLLLNGAPDKECQK